jgi:hypothetical protein
MAVYPEKGGVALTLKFQSRSTSKSDYTANIKQVKNKIIGRDTPAAFDVSRDFQSLVQKDSYDHPEQPRPFIMLP